MAQARSAAPAGSFAGSFRRVLSRYRTKLYAALGGAALWLVASRAAPVSDAVWVAVGLAPLAAALVLPRYAALIGRLEDRINLKLALVTPARLVRVVLLAPLVALVAGAAAALGAEVWSGGWREQAALLAAVNGLYALAVTLAYHGHGERTGNGVLAMAGGAWLVAASGAHWTMWPLTLALAGVFVVHLGMGLLSDLRSRFYPRRGVGVFFGSFNPVHKMHLKLLGDLIEERNLDKVYVHATTVPKLHRDALKAGEIEVVERAGVREYRKSACADPGKNYFPTGSWFYAYELRLELLRAAIRDAGLEGKVEVLNCPEVYERDGFFGVLAHVRARHTGQPIHGLHGSDPGGMWVRNIFDDSGWIYPFPVTRTGHVSATAIREGAVGLTSATVEKFLAAKRRGEDFVFPSGYVFRNG